VSLRAVGYRDKLQKKIHSEDDENKAQQTGCEVVEVFHSFFIG
jgi:hypothetical protein